MDNILILTLSGADLSSYVCILKEAASAFTRSSLKPELSIPRLSELSPKNSAIASASVIPYEVKRSSFSVWILSSFPSA